MTLSSALFADTTTGLVLYFYRSTSGMEMPRCNTGTVESVRAELEDSVTPFVRGQVIADEASKQAALADLTDRLIAAPKDETGLIFSLEYAIKDLTELTF